MNQSFPVINLAEKIKPSNDNIDLHGLYAVNPVNKGEVINTAELIKRLYRMHFILSAPWQTLRLRDCTDQLYKLDILYIFTLQLPRQGKSITEEGWDLTTPTFIIFNPRRNDRLWHDFEWILATQK